MQLATYLKSMEGSLFKILPLWEETHLRDDTHLNVYISMLLDEMAGAQSTFPVLQNDASYIAIINILQFMKAAELDHTDCRRKVFRMLTLLQYVNGGA